MNSYRWVVLAMVWLVYAGMGAAMSSMSPLVTPVLADLKMSYGEMGVILGSWQLAFIPSSLVAGIALDKWGIRRTVFAGAVVVALSVGLRYFATGFTNLLLMVALFGVGAPAIAVGAQKAVSLWFTGRDRAAAVGIYMTAPSVGGVFALAATNSLIMPLTGHSWRLAFLFYGLLTLSLSCIWLLVVRDIRRTSESGGASLRSVLVRILRVPSIRIVLIAGLIMGFLVHGFGQWLPKMLENGGISAQSAGFMASIVSVAGIPSTLVLPRIVPRRLIGRFLALFASLTSAGILLSAATSSWVIAGLVLYGVAMAVLFPLLTVVLMDDPQVGSRSMGVAGAILFAFVQVGGSAGPMLMSITVGTTGSFLRGIWVLAAAGLLLAALAFALHESKREPSVATGAET